MYTIFSWRAFRCTFGVRPIVSKHITTYPKQSNIEADSQNFLEKDSNWFPDEIFQKQHAKKRECLDELETAKKYKNYDQEFSFRKLNNVLNQLMQQSPYSCKSKSKTKSSSKYNHSSYQFSRPSTTSSSLHINTPKMAFTFPRRAIQVLFFILVSRFFYILVIVGG